MDRTQGLLQAAQEEVAQARVEVASSQGLPWVAPAAVAYEDQVRAAAADLGRCARVLAGVDDVLAAQRRGGPVWCTSGEGPAPVLAGWSMPVSRSMIGGTSVQVGANGVTSVDPAALQEAAGRLASAAHRLDHVQRSLSTLTAVLPVPVVPDPSQRAALQHALTAAWAPYRVAEHLQELARRLRGAAAVHAAGESSVAGFVRGAAALWGGLVGRQPAPLLAAEGVAVAGILGVAGLAVVGETVRAVGPRNAETLLGAAGAAAGKVAVRSGAVEVATTAVSGVARAQTVGGVPSLHPVPDGAAALAGVLTGPAGTAVVRPVAEPVQRAAPHGVGGVMAVVAATYEGSSGDGSGSTDAATVTVQRLDHADGTRSWLVAVPGTQSWAMSGTIPNDMGSNLRLEGGIADTMTAGVLEAMRQAGIGAGEPVVLAGHSQGGMVASHVAALAAGTFTIGAVVTAGSPDVPAALPSNVPVVRMEHVEDGTARLDGAPTRVTSQVTVIRRELSEDGTGTPDWGAAHAVERYVETAQRVDSAVADAPGSVPGVGALDRALGGAGTTATTSQYVVRRQAG